MSSTPGAADASKPTTPDTNPPPRRWVALLGTADGIVKVRAGITASTATEALDYLERTILFEALLGLIETAPPNDLASPPSHLDTAATRTINSTHLAGTSLFRDHSERATFTV